jgi:hypothetical protein
MNFDSDSPRLRPAQPLLGRVRNFLATWRDGVEEALRHEIRLEFDEFPLLRPRCCRNRERGMML